MSLITEEIIDQAIAAAEAGHINGLTYKQSSWGSECETACCVLGFARHIAGLPLRQAGPQDDEFADTPRIRAIRQLMSSPTPAILAVMKRVTADGKIDLRGADLRGADLSDADLRDADLRDADLRGADLSGAHLSDADLRADLRGATMRKADLSGADLSGADLRGADLSDADLSDADLSDAHLSGADLNGADLRGAVRWDSVQSEYVAVTDEWVRKRGAIR